MSPNMIGNHTQIEFTDELENLTSSPSVKVIYFLLFCVNQVVSLSCYSGFVYFEHHGGDPMKRSIKVNTNVKYWQSKTTKLIKEFLF